MNGALEDDARESKATEDEAFFRQGLCRHWTRKFGRRADGLSRLSGISDLGLLSLGALAIGAALRWPAHAPQHAAAIVCGIVVGGLILSHAANRSFRALEAQAFAELEAELAGKPSTRKSNSPSHLLAKFVVGPNVRAKHAWVEHRMKAFLARRSGQEEPAGLFGFHSLAPSAVYGTTGEDSNSAVFA
jgi:hypothetical protein